jgi:hypothetical protein
MAESQLGHMTFLIGERGVRFLTEFFGHEGHVTQLGSCRLLTEFFGHASSLYCGFIAVLWLYRCTVMSSLHCDAMTPSLYCDAIARNQDAEKGVI